MLQSRISVRCSFTRPRRGHSAVRLSTSASRLFSIRHVALFDRFGEVPPEGLGARFDPPLEHFGGGAIDRIGAKTVFAERRLGEFDHVIVAMRDSAIY